MNYDPRFPHDHLWCKYRIDWTEWIESFVGWSLFLIVIYFCLPSLRWLLFEILYCLLG